MLNQSSDLLVAQSERLKVGGAVVEVPSRDVVPESGAKTRLTFKAMQVLLMLVNHHEHVVSREAILEWVWPDTMPTNDVVTQAITQLRRAFEDDAAAPSYIETIAKSGYRLVAPIQWLGPRAADVALSLPLQDKPRLHQEAGRPVFSVPVLLATSLALLVVGLAGWAWWSKPATGAASDASTISAATAVAELKVRKLTSQPHVEAWPRLSPDGSMLVYVEHDPARDSGHGRIKIQATTQVPPRDLIVSDPAVSDTLPVWSPDGREIAFKRFDENENCRIIIVPVSGGVERNVAGCPEGMLFDWTPDGRGLVASGSPRSGQDSGALQILDIENGLWRKHRYERATNDVDLEPHYSPDGRWLGFRRNFALNDIWMMPASGGKPVRLTHIESDIRGWDWTPDSRAIVFSRITSKGSALHRLDIASGKIRPLGGSGVFVDVASRAPVMVFELNQSKLQIQRYPLTSTDPFAQSQARTVFPSSGDDLLPSISPDGRRLAYYSDRSGEMLVWVGELDRPENTRPIDNLHPITRHPAAWSPDGKRLLVIGEVDDRPQLYEVELDSGRANPLPIADGNPIYAAYLTEKSWFVGVDTGGGTLNLRLYDVATRPWKLRAEIPRVAAIRKDDTDQGVYFTRPGLPGLWRTDPDLQHIVQVDDSRPSVTRYKAWVVRSGQVWLLDEKPGCALLWHTLTQLRTGVDGLCLDTEGVMPSAPSLSSDGEWVYVSSYPGFNTDIGVASLPPGD